MTRRMLRSSPGIIRGYSTQEDINAIVSMVTRKSPLHILPLDVIFLLLW